MRWLRRLFPSAQLRDCRFVLQAFGTQFVDELAWVDIERQTRQALTDGEEAVRRRMLIDGDPAKQVVGEMIAILCLNDIERGHEHIYRGVLGMTGQSKRNIFAGVVTGQLRDGWISLQEAGVANENMKRAVAEAG